MEKRIQCFMIRYFSSRFCEYVDCIIMKNIKKGKIKHNSKSRFYLEIIYSIN